MNELPVFNERRYPRSYDGRVVDKPVGLSVRTRLRPGVYWDEQNVLRTCAILEVTHPDGSTSRLAVLDAETHKPISIPWEAFPVEAGPPG